MNCQSLSLVVLLSSTLDLFLQMQKSISLNFVLQLNCKRITIQLLEYSPSSGAVSDLQEQIGKTKYKKSISRKQKELREIRWWQNNRNFREISNFLKNYSKPQLTNAKNTISWYSKTQNDNSFKKFQIFNVWPKNNFFGFWLSAWGAKDEGSPTRLLVNLYSLLRTVT